MIKLKNIKTCTTRRVYHTKVNRVAVISTSAIGRDGVGHRLPTLRSALKVPGTRIMTHHLLSVGPHLGLNILGRFLHSRQARRMLSTAQCSFIISTVSSLDPGMFLLCRTCREGVPIISSVNTKTGVSPSRIEVTSVSGAYGYTLTGTMHGQLHNLNIGGKVPIIFSARVTGPSTIMRIRNRRYGQAAAKAISCVPTVFKYCLTSCIVGRLGIRD